MDDRPLEEPEVAISRIDAKIADFESTILARLARKPVGDTELAFRPTPKEGTIFLQGQTLDRTTYAALWQWAQDVGAVVTGGYTAGNGTTTFTVPDARDRFIVGAGGTIAFASTGGAAARTLTTANMPSHGHAGTAAAVGNHTHDSGNGYMSSEGDHPGHFPTATINVGNGAGTILGLAAWNSGGTTRGGHSHFFTFDVLAGGGHSHSLTINNTGSGEAFDNRPPYLGFNVAVWT